MSAWPPEPPAGNGLTVLSARHDTAP